VPAGEEVVEVAGAEAKAVVGQGTHGRCWSSAAVSASRWEQRRAPPKPLPGPRSLISSRRSAFTMSPWESQTPTRAGPRTKALPRRAHAAARGRGTTSRSSRRSSGTCSPHRLAEGTAIAELDRSGANTGQPLRRDRGRDRLRAEGDLDQHPGRMLADRLCQRDADRPRPPLPALPAGLGHKPRPGGHPRPITTRLAGHPANKRTTVNTVGNKPAPLLRIPPSPQTLGLVLLRKRHLEIPTHRYCLHEPQHTIYPD
jgi:hypothetical protein